jgi:hypothetical protein
MIYKLGFKCTGVPKAIDGGNELIIPHSNIKMQKTGAWNKIYAELNARF